MTGLEDIGRGRDQRNLQAFVKEIVALLGRQVAMKYLKSLELITRSAAAYGIDTTGLVPTQDEVDATDAREQQMAMASQFGPEALKQAGGMAQTAMKTPSP